MTSQIQFPVIFDPAFLLHATQWCSGLCIVGSYVTFAPCKLFVMMTVIIICNTFYTEKGYKFSSSRNCSQSDAKLNQAKWVRLLSREKKTLRKRGCVMLREIKPIHESIKSVTRWRVWQVSAQGDSYTINYSDDFVCTFFLIWRQDLYEDGGLPILYRCWQITGKFYWYNLTMKELTKSKRVYDGVRLNNSLQVC